MTDENDSSASLLCGDASASPADTEALPIVVDDPSGGPSVVFRSVDELKAELQAAPFTCKHDGQPNVRPA